MEIRYNEILDTIKLPLLQQACHFIWLEHKGNQQNVRVQGSRTRDIHTQLYKLVHMLTLLSTFKADFPFTLYILLLTY